MQKYSALKSSGVPSRFMTFYWQKKHPECYSFYTWQTIQNMRKIERGMFEKTLCTCLQFRSFEETYLVRMEEREWTPRCVAYFTVNILSVLRASYPFQFSLVTFQLCRALDANINSQKTQTYKFVYFTNHDADRSDINCVVCNLSNSFAQLNEASNFFLITSHCTAKNLPCKLQCRSLIWQFLMNITEVFSNSHMFIGSCRMYQWQGTSPCYLGNRRLLQFGPGHKILLIFSHI